MTTDLTVANTILAQLGGKRFSMMTGASLFVGTENSLSFKIGSNPKRINYVRVTLDPSDTYTIEFSRIRGVQCKRVASHSNVYADALQEVFTRVTGLYTRF